MYIRLYLLRHSKALRNSMADVWDLCPWVKGLREQRRAEFDATEQKLLIPRRAHMYSRAFRLKQPSKADMQLKTLRDALVFFDRTGMRRSKHQRLFHESMLSASIRHIYKDEDFSANFTHILEQNGWTEARQEARHHFAEHFYASNPVYCTAYSPTHIALHFYLRS